MKCEQRPFKKNKTRKKTPKKRPSRKYKAFIDNVSLGKSLIDSIANIKVTSREAHTYNNIESLINVNKIKSVAWDRATPIQRLAFFFYFLATNHDYSNILPFTLNISDEMKEYYSELIYEEKSMCIRKRLDDEFIKKLGYIPKYGFIIEYSEERHLHLHGIAEVDRKTEKKLREAMKVAAFGRDYQKSDIHRNMLRIEKGYHKHPKKWLQYINKNPSAGYSIFMTSELKRDIKTEYEALRNDFKVYKKSQKNTKTIITNEINQIIETPETKAQKISKISSPFIYFPVILKLHTSIPNIQRWYYLIRPPPLVQCIIMLYLIVFILSLWENLYIA